MLGYHHPPGADTPQEQTPPPRADTPPPEQTPPGSRPPSREQTPREQTPPPAYGQWAAGTHPTGMHSFFLLVYTPVFNPFCVHNNLWWKYYFIFERYEVVLIVEVCHTPGNICSLRDKSYFWDQPSVLIIPHRYFFNVDLYDQGEPKRGGLDIIS